MAQLAFKEGRHEEGFHYLFAEYLTNDKDAKDNYEKMGWVPALDRPMLAVRWGVGVDYKAGSYKGDARPIGTGVQTPQGRSGGPPGMPRGMGPGSSGGFPGAGGAPGFPGGGAPGFPGSPGGGQGGDVIARLTGDVGTGVMERLKSRVAEGGVFGEVLKDMASQAPAAANSGSGGFGAAPGIPGGSGFPGGATPPGGSGSPNDGPPRSGFPGGNGPPGSGGAPGSGFPGGGGPPGATPPPGVGGAPGSGFPGGGGPPGATPPPGVGGAPGSGFPGGGGPPGATPPSGVGGAPGSGFPGGGGPPGAPGGAPGYSAPGGNTAASGDGPRQIVPGLMFLGQDKREDLLRLAKSEELDVLLVFDVQVSENKKTGIVTNTTKIMLYNVSTGEMLEKAAVRGLKNTDVERAREKGVDDDPVERTLEQLFEFIDTELALSDEVPETLTAEDVVTRANTLMESGKDRVLQKLNELRFYRSRGLIDNDQLLAGYTKLAGDLGTQLAGKSSEKKEAAEKLLDKVK